MYDIVGDSRSEILFHAKPIFQSSPTADADAQSGPQKYPQRSDLARLTQFELVVAILVCTPLRRGPNNDPSVFRRTQFLRIMRRDDVIQGSGLVSLARSLAKATLLIGSLLGDFF